MIKFIFIITGLLITINSFGTAQVPDLIIYKGDTLLLHTNPLESFYNEDNPRPNHFYVSSCGTACWRGYQAIWEIKDNKLYLNAIQDCCLLYSYKITTNSISKMKNSDLPPEIVSKIEKLKGKGFNEWYFTKILKKKIGRKNFKKYGNQIFGLTKNEKRKAPLQMLFKDIDVDGLVHASWFTGDLKIPKGKMISYVHMGYMSIYEKEMILEIEKGVVLDAREYDNTSGEIQKGFGILQATSYSLIVPLEVIPNKKDYYYTFTDTLEYKNELETIRVSAYSKLNSGRKEKQQRKDLVESTIDSLALELSDIYTFFKKETEELRWGTACWIDGKNNQTNERIRIFTMSNINTQVIIEYIEKEINEEDFKEKINYITNSIILMEFGY